MSNKVEIEAMMATPTKFDRLDLTIDAIGLQIVRAALIEATNDGVEHPSRAGFVLRPYSLAEGPLMVAVEEHDRDDPGSIPARYDFTMYADHTNSVKMDRVEGSLRQTQLAPRQYDIKDLSAFGLRRFRDQVVAEIAEYN